MRFSFFLMALCFLHSSPVLSDGDNTIFELEDFAFESGATLPNARLSYVTYGALNESKTNVVHRPSWYSGNHHGYEFLSGPGKALDSSEYFIVATDMFANGLTSSPSNTPPPFAGPDFPEIAIRDNVNATHRLLTEELGVEHLRAVIGFSMGAQQAFQWAVSHPDMVEAAVAICGNAKEYPFGIVRLEGAKSALMATAHGTRGATTNHPRLASRRLHVIGPRGAFRKSGGAARLTASSAMPASKSACWRWKKAGCAETRTTCSGKPRCGKDTTWAIRPASGAISRKRFAPSKPECFSCPRKPICTFPSPTLSTKAVSFLMRSSFRYHRYGDTVRVRAEARGTPSS